MLKYFVELVGTFFFLSVIMVAVKSNIKWVFLPIGLALAMVVFWGGSISGGHFNPAVSIMFLMNGELSVMDTIVYIMSQIVGGILALVYYHNYALV
jgi:aquaporin Z